MKKLIFVLALMFAFTLNANAQETKVSIQDNAKKEAAMLAETVGLSETQTQDLYRLFEMKYRTLQDENVSIEKKKEFLTIVMAKVRASLDEKQMKKLEANTEMLNRLQSGVQSK